MRKKVYGYVRVSTRKQNPQRQYSNIGRYAASKGIIIDKYYEDKFTGTVQSRPEFDKMKSRIEEDLKKGHAVQIIFDSVSRMSRNADDGVKQYFEWYDKDVSLIFIHEMPISTDQYTQSLKEVGYTGTDADLILKGVNEFLRKLATNQIISAFEQSEKEARDIKSRVIEGLNNSNKKCGRPTIEISGRVETAKSIEAKKYIQKNSRRYKGNLNDSQCMKLAGISRPSFYKYVKELEEDNIKARA